MWTPEDEDEINLLVDIITSRPHGDPSPWDAPHTPPARPPAGTLTGPACYRCARPLADTALGDAVAGMHRACRNNALEMWGRIW